MKRKIKKVLINREGKKLYWSSGDIHTHLGVIKEADIEKKERIRTQNGDEWYVLSATFLDQLEKIERGPAIMLKKDIGIILANIPLEKKTKIVDAGSGCGVLAAYLARGEAKVTTYEIDEKNIERAKRNAESLGVKCAFKNKDIAQGIDEKNVDVITLDLGNPWKVFPHAVKSLKRGGMLIVYAPQITQVEKIVQEAKDNFVLIKACEVIEREWVVESPILRPRHQGLMHTAFLVFLRKI